MCHNVTIYIFYSGIDIAGSTVGIAYVGTMCNYDSSVGVTQVGSNMWYTYNNWKISNYNNRN